MNIIPQKLAIKYNPPRLCLIYQANNESFFHDFPINIEDMKIPSDKLYTKLKINNPGYLDNIEKDQVIEIIDLIKKNSQKFSKAQKLRGIVTGYRSPDLIEHHSSGDEEGVFDFARVEKQFDSDSNNSDIDLQL